MIYFLSVFNFNNLYALNRVGMRIIIILLSCILVACSTSLTKKALIPEANIELKNLNIWVARGGRVSIKVPGLYAEAFLEFKGSKYVVDLGSGVLEYVADQEALNNTFFYRVRIDGDYSAWAKVDVHILSQQQGRVFNLGRGGDTTRDLLQRIKSLRDINPNLVVLFIGTNDALNSAKMVGLQEYGNNLYQIIDTIKLYTTASNIILVTIPPAIEIYLFERHSADSFKEYSSVENKITSYNEVIVNVAKTASLPLIDLYDIIQANGGGSTLKGSLLRNEMNSGVRDGVHLTNIGYQELANSIYQEIIKIGIGQGGLLCLGDSHTAGVGSLKSYPLYLSELLGYKLVDPEL